MRKLTLVTIIIACSFSVLAQNEQTKTAEYAPVAGKDEEGKVLTSVERMPEFPGGQSGLLKYLSENIQYPEQARKEGIQGKVIVRFVVSKSGKVKNVELLREIGRGCGKEALRVVEAMPKWKPGMQDGVPVNVYFTLPISFKLSDPVTPEQVRFR